MAYAQFSDALNVWDVAFEKALDDEHPRKDPNATVDEVYLLLFGTSTRDASAAQKDPGRAVLRADTTFHWPGGTYDKGEIPRGQIESIIIYDANGLATLTINHLSLTYKQLLQPNSATGLAKLIFSGDDEMAEYNGSQPIYGWGGKDTILITTLSARAHGGNGNDTISSRNYTDAGTNRLYGDAGKDRITGSDSGDEAPGTGLDKLYGGTGNDRLYGRGGLDVLNGGDGNDLVVGGRGADMLTGGKGKNTFDFAFDSATNVIRADSGLAAADRDVINDFVRGTDRIRLSPTVDAEFDFIGKDEFTATNQIRFEKTDKGVTVFFNVDADIDADFAIELKAITSLNGADFGL